MADQVVINDKIGEHAVAIIYDSDADQVLAFDRQVGGKTIDLVPTDDGFSSASGMRWTLTGQPLTDETPPLQPVWIERQWWLGWVEFHPATEVYQTAI